MNKRLTVSLTLIKSINLSEPQFSRQKWGCLIALEYLVKGHCNLQMASCMLSVHPLGPSSVGVWASVLGESLGLKGTIFDHYLGHV